METGGYPYPSITYKEIEEKISTILDSSNAPAIAALVAVVNALFARVSAAPGSNR